MPRGKYPVDYLSNAHIQKPMDEIYADLDHYTVEVFEADTSAHSTLYLRHVLPPLWYDGVFVRGIAFNQAMDYTHKLLPMLKDLSFSVGCSMWCSFSWMESIDATMMPYANPDRLDWFRRTYPERRHQRVIPMLDTDYTHEYIVAPPFQVKKTRDILCIARLDPCKNLEMLATALKVYRQKYPAEPVRLTLVIGREFDINQQDLSPAQRAEMRKIEAVLQHPSDYIEFIPRCEYTKIPELYASSKVVVMPSLVEGKPRSVYEAMLCDTPVVCFEAFNQYARGGTRFFPDGAGLMAPDFEAESLADTLYTALHNLDAFSPRKRYLEWSGGRARYFNLMMDTFADYYADVVPGFTQGGEHHRNLWLDLAMQANYQLGLYDYIYDRNHSISVPDKIEGITRIHGFYQDRRRFFSLPPDAAREPRTVPEESLSGNPSARP